LSSEISKNLITKLTSAIHRLTMNIDVNSALLYLSQFIVT